MNIISQVIGLLIVSTLISCSNSDNNKVKNNSTSKSKENNTDSLLQDTTIITIQDSTSILGDKIILSKSKDSNGLTSPDTIYLVKEFNDSIGALNFTNKSQIPLIIIPNSDYYYLEKNRKYSVFSKSKPSISHKTKIIYKIRKNNFHDDLFLNPEQLKHVYSNYNVQQMPSEEIYAITPYKNYEYARLFIRLIKFKNNSAQVNALTINDFELTSFVKTKNGYLLGLNDFGNGASNYFTDKPYSCKVILLNQTLTIIGEYYAYLPSTHLIKVNHDKKGNYATFELHMACDQCEAQFCIYDVYFDESFNPDFVRILKKPSGITISPDTLLYCIKNKTSLPVLWSE